MHHLHSPFKVCQTFVNYITNINKLEIANYYTNSSFDFLAAVFDLVGGHVEHFGKHFQRHVCRLLGPGEHLQHQLLNELKVGHLLWHFDFALVNLFELGVPVCLPALLLWDYEFFIDRYSSATRLYYRILTSTGGLLHFVLFLGQVLLELLLLHHEDPSGLLLLAERLRVQGRQFEDAFYGRQQVLVLLYLIDLLGELLTLLDVAGVLHSLVRVLHNIQCENAHCQVTDLSQRSANDFVWSAIRDCLCLILRDLVLRILQWFLVSQLTLFVLLDYLVRLSFHILYFYYYNASVLLS